MPHLFNKTQLMAGLQCSKHLHLLVNHPEHASDTRTPASITGEVVEEHAQREFPGAVTVQRFGQGLDPVAQTRQLLGDPSVHTIFQAAFSSDFNGSKVRVFIDVLQRNHSQQNQWDLIEIKAATSVKEHFIDDVAIQARTAHEAGLSIQRIFLMHINNEFIYQGKHNYDGLFNREDITEAVKAHWHLVADNVQRFAEIIADPEPEIHISGHCKKPYLCEFRQYCESREPAYPVGLLPRGQKIVPTLLANGIFDIRDIPPDMLNSNKHQRIRHVTVTGKAEQLPGAQDILNQLPYPRYYLDFESIQFAIPIWAGTHPYDQLPFQWSCHIENKNQPLDHDEFLDVSGEDPRRAFAEQLIHTCQVPGPIIVYNQTFEKGVIKQLAGAFHDLKPQLLALNERIVDLLPIVEQHYYHPQMKGSWSIKNVLPCLVPQLKYSNLGEVQDGTQAQQTYFDIISGALSEERKTRLIQDLKDYCKLDTLAMVRIAESLVN